VRDPSNRRSGFRKGALSKSENRVLGIPTNGCGWQAVSNLYEVPDVDIKDRNFYDQKAKEIGITDWKELMVILDEDPEGMVKILELRGIRM
jgi:hypothetical protein